ncbi:MAG: hypothetical protein PHV10_08250 [Sulfuricurvum sp.]|nr:hypothetical protein [Sulfuricurvum sp.]
MKHLLLIGMILLISGCSKPYMSTIYPDDKQMILKDRAVDLPMPFYDLSMKSQDYPRCHKKGFCSLFPEFRESDFIKMNHPWNMMTDENGYSVGIEQTLPNGAIVLDYSIQFSASILPYTERERALEEKNIAYMKTSKTWIKPTDLVTIEHHGKENYFCFVVETSEIKRGRKSKIYYCDKFNPERTITKHITINITYTCAPNLPKELEPLAREYTYEDLQKRSQRILDSLYIKDEWEK